MGFGGRIGDTLRVPGRGVRRGITVLTVLVLAGGVGSAVSLTAPTLVSDLGLAGAPAAVEPVPPVPSLGPLAATAPLPTTAGLESALGAAVEEMPGRFTGTVLDPVTGDVLWASDADRALVPGSTAKILTAAAALLTLNPTDGFVTRVVAGAEPGTVVLVGGGDPTLTALPEGEDGTYPGAARLAELAAEVQQAATGPIDTVVIDTSRYDGPTSAPGWDPADVGAGFVTPIVPLMLDGGRADPSLQDGPRTTEPAAEAGQALARLLGADDVEEGTATPDAQRLGAVTSAPFSELVEHVMRTSDNVLAEALAREVAIARGGQPTFAGAAEQTLAALTQAGFDPTGAVLVDGSGLSTQDEVPARVLGTLLTAAATPAEGDRDTDFLRPLITGLPVAGGDGTLDDRFGAEAPSSPGRGLVRAKTGTLTNVSSLAGLVTDADGRLLVFAFMSNGASPATVRPRLDALAAELSGCGCT
ncbi:D-alanyl-D-alanine carboxypeptidase/D-alanyl-D-alanine-endopeptidase [Pseudonocardia sp. KRD-184]|uniref:D-alanyl-D-alanine carboxypeptidase/D-alanyl-D-alanine-endopeptidase n=1 Tax=Pseudonocardia oceani TaxID=2792013 RepID=A0ABS6U9N4_9PSEU|nr:D-alanyl-D-alanine carboxypeptidase/D-alanyl-D-alanine-endopeptidase [Pseudonocardia oceani]MBW0088376.1 D-alanyl-D-alanine carboxypeptidase/D-alanyl-D-alanine-endopeptidase [Pseudonocardia oceani]MBW0094961.1 D-alanyl-D-alanine carboxypeptidase/D-alanyl-D-alanine-endopeptidase [Pseudonocardia oceani]MBW0107764.1 D-alanyl-D-alanine carboxypeptidase/D-alanyl-D-alanine-endopeptidase [Pseudonocardia oceani]MBW0120222.1 D-alanyl-D-alanine carboxypeptidase/D-alanyl-D-alanine-endopeptidase [Pseudo